MGFICGVLLMYMGEDDVLPACDPSINSCPQWAMMGQAFLMLISLLENYRMAGLFMRGPWALYPTIHAYTTWIVHNNKYLYDKMN